MGSQRPLSWLLLALFGLGSKRGNVKPSYLMEIHSEIVHCFTFWSITARIQARSLWNLLYIWFIIFQWRGARGRYLDYFLHFWGLGSKRSNVKPSYLIEIHSEIGTLFHILVHHGPNTGQIVMKFAVYIVYDICKRMEGGQRPLSRLLLALLGPWKQTR